MSKLLNHNNAITLYSILIFLLSSYFIFHNFFNDSGYWFDEWCTLLSSDPNVGLNIINERHHGNFEKPYENVPIIYYLVLRFFFSIFGYTSENGRIFSYQISLVEIFLFLLLSTLKGAFQSMTMVINLLSEALIMW